MRWFRRTLFLGVVMAAAPTAHAQEEPIETRLEKVAGLKPADVRAFFATLRSGLASGNTRAVCALVAYPLPQPSGPVSSAADCAARYDDIFTIAVRRTVGRAQFDELFVAPTAVVFGYGELWFARCQGVACPDGALRITQVNGAGDGTLKPPAGKTLLACAMAGAGEGRWATLTADGDGGAVLRIWMPSAGLHATSPPAILLKSQPVSQPASPRCAFRTHAFTDATTSYTVVSETMCAELDDRIPPMGTVGVVTRATGGASPDTIWCIQ